MLILTTTVLPGRTGRGPDIRRSTARLDITGSLVIAGMHSGMGMRLTLGAATLLVHLERVDAPVGLGESGGVVLDVGIAGASLGGTATRRPDVAGPVTAESNVEDLNVMLVGSVFRGLIRGREE
jgi:hypothetical protein